MGRTIGKKKKSKTHGLRWKQFDR